jgi:hypothetical protein
VKINIKNGHILWQNMQIPDGFTMPIFDSSGNIIVGEIGFVMK